MPEELRIPGAHRFNVTYHLKQELHCVRFLQFCLIIRPLINSPNDSQVQLSNGGLKKHKPRKVICHRSPSIAEFTTTTSLYARKVLWEVVAPELSTLLESWAEIVLTSSVFFFNWKDGAYIMFLYI